MSESGTPDDQEDDQQQRIQDEIVEQDEQDVNPVGVAQKANLDRDIRKQHFFTISTISRGRFKNGQAKSKKILQLHKPYPKSSQLEAIFNQYKRIQQLKPSEDEVFLKLEDQQFQKERKFTISEVRALRKERNHKYFKYLIEVRKNFVSDELFSKFRKKVKVFSFDENAANKEKQNENSIDESVEKESDVFSNYSEFY
ncbi:unnamed protein product (macronuclear) [Paramecium tetraurelia]|uniref:Uncharacterized protein n=1 Tax=Paramecium tetraurelia TaxID=5888 RepID=A0DA95_PARTE|nr:uncharacterized protein GSPATT00014869001 [Paramecium tetraurelia]CAK79962.1 unnamed protein product [Paramecium tetraurelia]|eukprot:XP_001447359.1 hypothetical protein (macronuclear) [Paramecium tetraurelia strain d4-2]